MEKLNKFRGWGAVAKYFQGAEEVFFQGFGEINTLFKESRGAKTPWGPQYLTWWY